MYHPRMKSISVVLIAACCLTPSLASAETFQFIQTVFYNTYSFAHPPALHIKPADRVITKTIDAGGVDWDGKTVAAGPNPQTGPFYIDGAEPGDVLIVTIEKLETNRSSANSGSLACALHCGPGGHRDTRWIAKPSA